MNFARAIVLATTLAFSTAAVAAPIIDQNSPSGTANNMAGFGQGDLAQSFQQARNNITGAGIYLFNGGGAGDITISLYDKLPNVGGNLLATSTAQGEAGNWVDVFWASTAISADTTYYLVFTSNNRFLAISGDTSNPYAKGNVFANQGYGSFDEYDYTFRTFASDDQVVPEPGSLALLGLALAGLSMVRVRKQ